MGAEGQGRRGAEVHGRRGAGAQRRMGESGRMRRLARTHNLEAGGCEPPFDTPLRRALLIN
jgi:hypothetical protein